MVEAPFKELLIDTTRSYVSSRLANHFERSLGSDSEVIATVLVTLLGTLILMKVSPPRSLAVRKFRTMVLPIAIFSMTYRFFTGKCLLRTHYTTFFAVVALSRDPQGTAQP